MAALLIILGLGAAFALTALIGGGTSDADDTGTSTGPDTITGSEGDDIISDASYRTGFTTNLDDLVTEGEITQTEADAVLTSIVFTQGAQELATQGGDDLVLAGGGNDRIDTGAGDDSAAGGAGDDRVRLGDGDDVYGSDSRTVTGPDDQLTVESDFSVFAPDAVTEGGNDTVAGGAGDDFIADGFGANLLQGQQGRDVIVAVDQDALSPDTVDGGFGRDALFVDQGDQVTGGAGADTITLDLFGADLTGYQPMTITDFVRGEDVLVLEGTPALLRAPAPVSPTDAPVDPVSVADVAGTADAAVAINGVVVALVKGGQGLARADIRIST